MTLSTTSNVDALKKTWERAIIVLTEMRSLEADTTSYARRLVSSAIGPRVIMAARASDPKVESTFGIGSDAPLFEERIVECEKPDPLFRTIR